MGRICAIHLRLLHHEYLVQPVPVCVQDGIGRNLSRGTCHRIVKSLPLPDKMELHVRDPILYVQVWKDHRVPHFLASMHTNASIVDGLKQALHSPWHNPRLSVPAHAIGEPLLPGIPFPSFKLDVGPASHNPVAHTDDLGQAVPIHVTTEIVFVISIAG